MESYCHHCIDAKASKLVYVDGRDYWLCRGCAAHYGKKRKLPDLKVGFGLSVGGGGRPPLLDEMERKMGGEIATLDRRTGLLTIEWRRGG
jgi:hypothetical protein